MKGFLLLSVTLLTFGFCFSQITTPKPATKTVTAPKPFLKDLRDSASYAMGLFLVNVFREQGINNINSAAVARAINDRQAKKPQLLNDNLANNAIMTYHGKMLSLKLKPNIDAGMKFLSDNRQRPGIKTTPSGLQYEIITEGTGPKPLIGDSVSCNYIGTFINGTEFDNSYKTGKPVSFAVTGVIPGWTEALLMMPVGSKWKVYVPYQLGYGFSDHYSIPGGSALIFEMELVSIKGK